MKKILLVDPLNCSLTVPIAGLCNCLAQQVFDLKQADDQMQKETYDFLIIDPYRFGPVILSPWLSNLRAKKPQLKIVFLSSFNQNTFKQKFPSISQEQYDFFIYSSPWPMLKKIISN